MLKVFLKINQQSWLQSIKLVTTTFRAASFTVRDVLRETSDETGTLLTNFAKHIALDSNKSIPVLPTTIRYSSYFPITNMHYFEKELKRTPVDQLPALIVFLFTYRSNADPAKFAEALNVLDAFAVRHLHEMDDDSILRTLYSLLFVIPNWMTRIDFYYRAVKQLSQNFSPDDPKEKFVQLCFYLGLEKKRGRTSSEALHKLLDKHLDNYLHDLSTMDLALVCNAAYKTSTPVDNNSYNLRLEEEVEKLPFEGFLFDALLVTFIKAMRFQRIHSESVCQRLTELCTRANGLKKLQAPGLTHIFAYFAENLWDDSETMQMLTAEFMERLQHDTKFGSPEKLRGKDIATFLWCCTRLNVALMPMELQRIEGVLLNKLRYDEFKYFPDQLVDCCLSLWALGKRSRHLFEEAVYLKTTANANRNQRREQPRVDSRLTVLLSAVNIEEPTWSKTSNIPNAESKKSQSDVTAPAYLLRDRKDLSDFAERLSEEKEVQSVRLTSPINGLNMPGIEVELNENDGSQKISIELLTPKQILRFSRSPVGLVLLKARLLKALGHKVLVLHPEDIADKYTSIKDLFLKVESLEERATEDKKHSAQTI